VRTALDRLQAEGIIAAWDPAIIAAKIKRADQRPQGWDLAMHLIRDDLDDEDLATLERQFPGLTARIRAARAAAGVLAEGSDHGVQQLHSASHPVDNPADEVQPLHLAGATGCNCCRNGVQRLHPNRPLNHPRTVRRLRRRPMPLWPSTAPCTTCSPIPLQIDSRPHRPGSQGGSLTQDVSDGHVASAG
jgi:hypothetical protein